MTIPMTTQGAANSVQGPKGGLQSATTTTPVVFDLRAYAGLWVRVKGTGADHYAVFGAAAAAQTIDATTATLAASAPLATAPDDLEDSVAEHWLVDGDKPYLTVQCVTGTGYFRIRRS
jgi:hypothetical protein